MARTPGGAKSKRVVLVALVLLVLVVVVALSIGWGSRSIDPGTVWQALTAPDP
ncbi:hypothetical protein [Renibacterium salmoninarum]|uniref:hypothetical protein n=1 Tax=Renibacterium salmoninarum TaxID=1646 RepID=UPI001F1C3FA9|nr:hypothetical protein [Renibacterium salmoninarum]